VWYAGEPEGLAEREELSPVFQEDGDWQDIQMDVLGT